MEQWETEFIAKVRELAQGPIAQHAAEVDRSGVLSQENVATLKEVGATRAPLPTEYGGMGLSMEGTARMMEEIAYVDGSTAIALNVRMLVADSLLFTPPWPHREAVLNEIGSNGAVISMPGSVPLAELDTRPAGFRFREEGEMLIGTGKSGFATMSDAADYLMIGGTLDRGEGQEPDLVFALPSTSTPGVKVMGNWDAMGLHATASHDVEFNDIAVPKSETMIVSAADFRAFATGVAPGRRSRRAAQGARAVSRRRTGAVASWV